MKTLMTTLAIVMLGAINCAIADEPATDGTATDFDRPENQSRLTLDPMRILDPGAKKTAESTGRAAEPLEAELESLLEEAEAAEK